MREHIAITMSVSVPLVHTLLVLFFPISAAAAGGKCSNLKHEVELKWIPEYEKFHKGLGLTFDCEAMKKADESAGKLKANNGKNYEVGDEWCQYSRLEKDSLHAYLSSPTLPMNRMPLDEIKKTVQLHPKTRYGCSARTYTSSFSVYHSIVCIYKKNAGETRCTNN
ncbi:hypothetical protein Q1695_015937 [Nippostrongylus brasiliensis]|nr:hypothetical protein Q1695_015937 [Nippostrongylus brasiliensis]